METVTLIFSAIGAISALVILEHCVFLWCRRRRRRLRSKDGALLQVDVRGPYRRRGRK